MSSAPKLQANVVGDFEDSISFRYEMSSLVFSARFIKTSTPNDAADTHDEKHACQNAAHHHFRQPAADRASDIDSRNRSEKQSNEKPVVDISKLQMSQSCNRHERDRMREI